MLTRGAETLLLENDKQDKSGTYSCGALTLRDTVPNIAIYKK